MTESARRQPHAALAIDGRRKKAAKIKRLLGLDQASKRPLRLLEVGCGAGVIAHYFATNPDLICIVEAVDVVDQRRISECYSFRVVDGVQLPFADASFDVILSNHVIEHVGDHIEQCDHLREMARVLSSDGVIYLASPNRWQFIEPHYHLAFLSWLPRTLRNSWLRLFRKGDFYDCEPLQMGELERMAGAVDLVCTNLCVPALRDMLMSERAATWLARVLGVVPDALLHRLRRFSPTHIYQLRHRTTSPA